MKNGFFAAALAALLTTAAAGPASAVTTFDLTGTDAQAEQRELTENGRTLTVRGLSGPVDQPGARVNLVTTTANGVGVFDPVPMQGRRPADDASINQVRGVGQYVELVFSRSVRLTSAFMGDFGRNDTVEVFNLTTGSAVQIGSFSLADIDFTGFAGTTGTSFAFASTDGNDSYFLSRVQVVPLPAGAVLLITGLGAFALIHRRRHGADTAA